MDRRKALAVSVAVAMVVATAAALAANFGLLGLVDRAGPVGQLSPVATVGSAVVPEQGGPEGAEDTGTVGGDPAPAVEAGHDARDDSKQADQPDDQREQEHERDD
jgi:hypothetical protein